MSSRESGRKRLYPL